MPGVHAVLTHDDVPGREDLRPRVRRPAGARDRPRALLRRAGRARRRRAPGAGAPRGRGDRASSTSRSSRSSTRSARPSRSRSTPTGRRWATATATTRGRTSSARMVIRHGDPDAEGDVTVEGVYERRHPGPGVPRARVRARGPGRRGRRRHLRRDAVAARRPRPGRAVPRPRARAGADPPRRRRRRVRRPRGPLDADPRRRCSRCTPDRPVKIVYNREESFVGHVHRHPARIWAEHRATRDGRLVCVRMRILLDGGAYASSSTAVISNACLVRARPVRGRQRADRGRRASTRTTRRAARCAASARCRRASPPRRRWTSSPRRSTSTRSSCGC